MAEENTRRTKARNAIIVLLLFFFGWCFYTYVLPMCTKPDCVDCNEVVRRSELNAKLDALIAAVNGVKDAVGNIKSTTDNRSYKTYYGCNNADDCSASVHTDARVISAKEAASNAEKEKQTKAAEAKAKQKKADEAAAKKLAKQNTEAKAQPKAEPKQEPKPEVKKEVEKQPEAPKEEAKVAEAPKPAPILAPAPINNNPEELSCGKKSVILDSNGKPLKGMLTNLKVNEEVTALMPTLSETYVSFGDELDQQMWIDCEPKAPQRFKPCINPIVDGSFVEDDGVRVGIKNQRYAINDAGKVVVDMKLGLGMNQSDAVNFKRLSELEIIQVGGRYCAVLPTS